MTTTLESNNIRLIPPTAPSEWTLKQIQAALSRELPPASLATRKQGNATLTYIPWYKVNGILDKYAPGWCWELTRLELNGDRLFISGRLTFPTADGVVWREATGTELLKEVVRDKTTGEPISRELAYGDPSSNAESMALRRAAAKFGLGLYLYDK
jgi:Rad52/22 family double-strand break repair protein